MKKIIYTTLIFVFCALFCSNAFGAINGGTHVLMKDCTGVEDANPAYCTGDCQCYSTWASFWNDLDTTITSNLTLNCYAGIYDTNDVPAHVTENLQTFTITVQPASLANRPFSSDGKTGVIFNVDDANEFLNLDMSGTGSVVIDGIVVVVDGTSPTEIFEINDDTPEVTIKNCIIKGDGETNDTEAILNNAASGVIEVYNNFIYDVYDGFLTTVALDSSSFVSANTIIDCEDDGIDAGGVAGTYENNLVQNCAASSCFVNIGSAVGNNNICEDTSCANLSWGAQSTIQLEPTSTINQELDNNTNSGGYAEIDSDNDAQYVGVQDTLVADQDDEYGFGNLPANEYGITKVV